MADYVIAICPQCNETLYRSSRPLAEEDKLLPELFAPVREDIPPPGGAEPECFTCGSRLRFSYEGALKQRPQLRSVKATSTAPPPSAPGAVEELFAVETGEEIKTIYPSGSSLVILTNKRVVRISMLPLTIGMASNAN